MGDIDEASARDLVRNLIAQGVVSPVETKRLLVHEPSETAFESMRQLVVDALAALTRFRVALGHLEGPLQLCANCCPDGPATYWTRTLEEHLVATPAE